MLNVLQLISFLLAYVRRTITQSMMINNNLKLLAGQFPNHFSCSSCKNEINMGWNKIFHFKYVNIFQDVVSNLSETASFFPITVEVPPAFKCHLKFC